MAASSQWQPKEEGFTEICGLLEQQISNSSSSADKSQIWQQLQHYSQFPDFNNYLAFILARAEVFMFLTLRFLRGIRDLARSCLFGYGGDCPLCVLIENLRVLVCVTGELWLSF